MPLAFVEIAIIALCFVLNIASICAVVSAAGFDRSAWAHVGRDKSGWIIAMLIMGIVAAPLYLLVVRPQLKRALLDEPLV